MTFQKYIHVEDTAQKKEQNKNYIPKNTTDNISNIAVRGKNSYIKQLYSTYTLPQ